MSSDRDGIRGGWATPDDDQPDAESAIEMTGEFTIDYAPPAWYTQNSGDTASGQGAAAAWGLWYAYAYTYTYARGRSAAGQRVPAAGQLVHAAASGHAGG